LSPPTRLRKSAKPQVTPAGIHAAVIHPAVIHPAVIHPAVIHPGVIHPGVIHEDPCARDFTVTTPQGGLGTSSYSAVLFLRRIAIIPRKQTASTAQTNRTVAASIVHLLFRSLQATANNFEWFGVG
jgi:hypothetical protein